MKANLYLVAWHQEQFQQRGHHPDDERAQAEQGGTTLEVTRTRFSDNDAAGILLGPILIGLLLPAVQAVR